MSQSRNGGEPGRRAPGPAPDGGGEDRYAREPVGQGISSLEYGGFDAPVYAPSRPAWARGHHGKGPKNYQRSDERIREEVCERLTFDPDIDASDISVFVKDREVRLSGTVEERPIKFMVEQLVSHVAGVEEIHNELRVRPRQPMARGDEADARERTEDGRTRWGTDAPTTQDS
jgi:hypothetical protein